jgi:dihydroorotate dehydrogenase (NAD+) catalytic subunit
MSNIDLSVNIKGLKFQNPVLTSSGTFGYGIEFFKFFDINLLGGITLKAVTLEPRFGNPTPRVAETPSGMLNAIGLANMGIDYFLDKIIPSLKPVKTNIIANVAGKTYEDYVFVADKLSNVKEIHAIEVNISCPNVKEGGIAFGQNPKSAEKIIKEIRKVYSGVMIVKLSPNVTDITEIAKVAENEGADAISLINTLKGMAIDINKMKPILSNVSGGLSGPAIKPVALRMVFECASKVKIPIIGMGGIFTHEDAVEFLLAGASLVSVGTANMVNPCASLDVKNGIEKYLKEKGFSSVREIIGKVKV